MAVDASGKTIIYVAPWGNDANSGLDANAPKASLNSAVQQSRSMWGSESIQMRGGDYYLTQKVALTNADNGLSITSYGNERAVLHGGPNVAGGWTDNWNGTYSKYVGNLSLAGSVEDLHINGDRVQPARYPNAPIGEFNSGFLMSQPGTGGYGTQYIKFTPGSIPYIADTNDLRINIYDTKQWTNANPKVSWIDYNAGAIYLAESISWHEYGAAARFYLYNSSSLLDATNEFDYNSQTKTITVKPDAAWELGAGNKVTAATLDTLIELNGASNITISGLGLTDTTYHGSDRASPWSGGSGGAIKVTYGNNIVISGNVIDGVGVGVNAQSTSNLKINYNTITDIAGKAIYIAPVYNTSNLNYSVEVGNNKIQNIGQVAVEAAGIWYQGVQNGWFHDNYITNSAQMGIVESQNDPYGRDYNRNNIIEYNVLRNLNTATSDAGGIKLFAAVDTGANNTIIRYNWVDGLTQSMTKSNGAVWGKGEWTNNTYPQPIGGAIFLDGPVKNVEGYGNIISNSYGGIYLYGAANTNFHDNVLWSNYAASYDIADQPGLWTGNNIFQQNIVYVDDANAAALRVSNTVSGNDIASFYNNTYWGPQVDWDAFLTWRSHYYDNQFQGDFKKWTTGLWGYSVAGEQNADAQLVNPWGNNFNLSGSSPAWAKGFDGINGKLQNMIWANGNGVGASGTVSPPAVSPPTASPPVASPPASPSAPGSTKVVVDVSNDPFGNWSNPGPNAQFELYVNGSKVGSTQTVTADHDYGQWQSITFDVGMAGSAINTLGVKFINNFGVAPYGQMDRNLYVQDITANGVTFTPGQGTLYPTTGGQQAGTEAIWSDGTLQWSTAGRIPASSSGGTVSPPPPPPTSSAGGTTIVVDASQDPFGNGWNPGPNAQFELYVNGAKLGSTQTVTVDHDYGQWQSFSFNSSLAASAISSVGVRFINDHAGSPYSAANDRNLWVQDITVGGTTYKANQGAFYPSTGGQQAGSEGLWVNGTLQWNTGGSAAAASPPAASSAGKFTVAIAAANDPYGNSWNPGPNAQFELYVNGAKVGSTQTVTVDHDTGQWQRFSLDVPMNAWDAHSLGIKFINDTAANPYNGSQDRNLWIDNITVQGKVLDTTQGTFYPATGGQQAGSDGIWVNGTLQWDLDRLVHSA